MYTVCLWCAPAVTLHIHVIREQDSMYILCIYVRVYPTSKRHAFHEQRISSVTFTSAHLCGNVYMRVGVARALADSSDFGLLGEQSSSKCEIPCLGRRWTALQNVTPLALSSAEKSVTVQTNTQTVNDISTPCLSACVDKNIQTACQLRNAIYSNVWQLMCDVLLLHRLLLPFFTVVEFLSYLRDTINGE